jgi:hypothetical protein
MKNKLTAKWNRKENDIVYHFPQGSPDARLLNDVLCGERLSAALKPLGHYQVEKSLRTELEERGYDITTLKFEIALKK